MSPISMMFTHTHNHMSESLLSAWYDILPVVVIVVVWCSFCYLWSIPAKQTSLAHVMALYYRQIMHVLMKMGNGGEGIRHKEPRECQQDLRYPSSRCVFMYVVCALALSLHGVKPKWELLREISGCNHLFFLLIAQSVRTYCELDTHGLEHGSINQLLEHPQMTNQSVRVVFIVETRIWEDMFEGWKQLLRQI